MPQKTFKTTGGRSISVSLNSKGSVEAGQTNGQPVRFSFDLSQTKTYEQSVIGDPTGKFRFTIGQSVKWNRRGEAYYWGESFVDSPDNIWFYPHDGRPAYTYCVGSDYYAANFAKLGRGYIPGGINLTRTHKDFGYRIPTRFTYGQGNDILSLMTGIDGRKYTMQLANLTYTNPAVWEASHNAPVLFYQDAGSSEWCQYFMPMDTYHNPQLKGVSRIWSGSSYIFKQDMTLSGCSFKRGQVFYLFCTPRFDREPNASIAGIPLTDDWYVFWGIAETIDEPASIFGIIQSNTPGMLSDPRMYFDEGKIKYAVAVEENGNSFAHVVIDTLRVSGRADFHITAEIKASALPPIPAGEPRFECEIPSATIRMADGTVRRFDELRIGDRLIWGNTVTHIMRGRDVLYRIASKSRELICNSAHKVILKDGQEIAAEKLFYSKKKSRHIKLPSGAYDLPEKPLDIPPYLLGLWLGDGDSSSGRITNADSQVCEYLKGLGADSKLLPHARAWRIRVPFLTAKLKAAGQIKNKHIPQDAQTWSLRQRLELIAGLTDTDGYYNQKENRLIFSQHERQHMSILLPFLDLLHSCGLSGGIRPAHHKQTNYGMDCNEFLSIAGDLSQIPSKKFNLRPHKQDTETWRIERLGEGDFIGISVSNPDKRYLKANGIISHNCPAPFIVGNKRIFSCCSQANHVPGTPGDVWNSIVNNQWFLDMNNDGSVSGAPQPVDIGYDSYAVIAHNADMADPSRNEGYLNTTAFNWGLMSAYPYVSGSYPFKKFKISDGKVDYDAEGWTAIDAAACKQAGEIGVYRGQTKITRIKLDDNQIFLDYDATPDDEFAWRRSDYFSSVRNIPAKVPKSAITGIYYKLMGAFACVMIKCAGFHDLLCGLYFMKDGAYGFGTPPIDNTDADAFNANIAQTRSDIYIENGTNFNNGWSNDNFGYGETSDGYKLSAVLSGSPQHQYFFVSKPGYDNWMPCGDINPFGTTWNGGIQIIRAPMTISGHSFAQDDIVISACDPSGASCVYIARLENGKLRAAPNIIRFRQAMNDPRITIDWNKKQFVLAWVNSNNAKGYSAAYIEDFDKAQLSSLYPVDIRYGGYRSLRDECGNPVIINGRNYIAFSFQNISSTGREGDFIALCDNSWKCLTDPIPLNLGYYNYAAAVSNFGGHKQHNYTDANGRVVPNTGFRVMYTVSNFSWKTSLRPNEIPYSVGTFIEMFENNGFIDYVVPQQAVKTTKTYGAGETISKGNYAAYPAAGGTVETWTWTQGSTYEWNVLRQVDANGAPNGHSMTWTRKLTGLGS